jgi:hypothetical protein
MSEGEFCPRQFNIPLTGSCEHCNELLGSVNNKELVGYVVQKFSTFGLVSHIII